MHTNSVTVNINHNCHPNNEQQNMKVPIFSSFVSFTRKVNLNSKPNTMNHNHNVNNLTNICNGSTALQWNNQIHSQAAAIPNMFNVYPNLANNNGTVTKVLQPTLRPTLRIFSTRNPPNCKTDAKYLEDTHPSNDTIFGSKSASPACIATNMSNAQHTKNNGYDIEYKCNSIPINTMKYSSQSKNGSSRSRYSQSQSNNSLFVHSYWNCGQWTKLTKYAPMDTSAVYWDNDSWLRIRPRLVIVEPNSIENTLMLSRLSTKFGNKKKYVVMYILCMGYI